MKKVNKKEKFNLELLAPAGSPEKLKYAIHYGADAVYCGLPDFSMRRRINSFSEKSLAEAVKFVHKKGKKIYVTVNIYPHNKSLAPIVRHLKFLEKLKVDAIILSDPGVLSLAKRYASSIPIHLSTQANAINWQAVKFWAIQGVERVILAREVTLKEMAEIHEKVPEVEIECFVHGAMCMSYSGRCVLSKWMTGRSANLGDCAQPCRWEYSVNYELGTNVRMKNSEEIKTMTVIDKKKEFIIDLEEDKNGTYFFNSKDLNLLAHLNKLKRAGIMSLKVEGRNKSVSYLATVIRAYRKVLDNLKSKKILREQSSELKKLMHRGYTTGFMFDREPEHNFQKSHEKTKYEFVGEVVASKKSVITAIVHNAIYKKDRLEIIDPEKNTPVRIKEILNQEKKKVTSAHGGQGKLYHLKLNKSGIGTMSLIRKIIP